MRDNLSNMFELKNKSIVVVANLFNPSIFNSHWFIKNEILKEEEILQGSICSQNLAQVTTNNFNMIVILNQLIMNLLIEKEIDSVNVLSKCIKNLAHTPYTAVGINFNYLAPTSNDINDNWSRKLFFYSTSPIHSLFDTPDARFGVYLSKEYEGSRLKLDIKPNSIQEINNPEIKQVINFSFNFHKDLPIDNASEELLSYLTKCELFKNYSESIMKKVYN